MLTSFRGPRAAFLAATFTAATLVLATPALAQDEEEASSPVTVTGSVGVVTDYRFRGVSLSAGDPAVQGGFTLTHESGFYAGTWGSSLDAGAAYGELELDVFGGWSGSVAEGVGLDVGLLYYAYPSNPAGAEVEYIEPYATVSGTLGPVQAKLGVAYAWEQDSLGGNDNLYVFTKFAAGIPNTPISLSAGVGYTDGALAPPLLAGTTDDTGFDWNVGASVTVLGNVSLGVTYRGVEGPSIDGFTDDAIVGSVTVAF